MNWVVVKSSHLIGVIVILLRLVWIWCDVHDQIAVENCIGAMEIKCDRETSLPFVAPWIHANLLMVVLKNKFYSTVKVYCPDRQAHGAAFKLAGRINLEHHAQPVGWVVYSQLNTLQYEYTSVQISHASICSSFIAQLGKVQAPIFTFADISFIWTEPIVSTVKVRFI